MVAGLVGSIYPTFGFIFQEPAHYGKLSSDVLQELTRNYILRMDSLSKLKAGEAITVRKVQSPDETVTLSADNLLLPKTKGRKIVVVNSGSDASTLAAAAKYVYPSSALN